MTKEPDPHEHTPQPTPTHPTHPPVVHPPVVHQPPVEPVHVKDKPKAGDKTPPAPSITALYPDAVAVGDPTFALRVIGKNFTATSVIVVAGEEAASTSYNGATDLSTVVNMALPLWQTPDAAIPVLVRDPGKTDSNTLTFALRPASGVQPPPR